MQKLLKTALAAAGGVLAAQLWRRRKRIDFADRSVVITGGSRGLGLELARCFAGEGARLTLLARNEEKLARAADELKEKGADVHIAVCDVRNEDDVRRTFDQVLERRGRIDVLINNAGIIVMAPYDHMTVEDFREAMDVHLWGPFNASRAVIPAMKRQGGGRIVNISSIGGKVAIPHLLSYCMSKFALTGLSDGLRAELARDGIHVTTVCPGLMRTGSHVNAWFKGQHEKEYSWFTHTNAFPLNSIHSRSAARKIMKACRYGRSHLTYTVSARLLITANALFPNMTAEVMKRANKWLPAPLVQGGNERHLGWESQSSAAPSALTRLADKQVIPNNQEKALSSDGKSL